MSPSDVSRLIADEVATVDGLWFTDGDNNPHALELSRCLVTPVRVTCNNSLPDYRGGKPFEVWLVLEERGSDGYYIIFDEETRAFGLAIGTRDRPEFIGWYGSFLETVRGM